MLDSELIHEALHKLEFRIEPGKKEPAYAYEHSLGPGKFLYVKRKKDRPVLKSPLVLHPQTFHQQSAINSIDGIRVNWQSPTKSTSYRAFPKFENRDSQYGFAAEVLTIEGLEMLTHLLTNSPVVRQSIKKESEPMDIAERKDKHIAPLNQIFYGPPGTGKTYHTAVEALKILDPAFFETVKDDYQAIRVRYDQLYNEGRISFVTFHQSFSYEDFVEGIRAETVEGKVQYNLEDGVFKKICNLATTKITSSQGSMDDIGSRRVWKMSLGNTQSDEDYVYEECIENGYSLLGWGGDIDFSDCLSPRHIRETFMANGYDEDKKSYAVSAVNTFRNTICTGDLIIVSDGNSKFRAIGEVTGDYQLLNTAERSGYRQCRPTRWLRVYEPSRPVDELFNKSLSQMSLYELKNHILKRDVLLQLLSTETKEQHKPYVMVIDEINRGNISRIFGELITLLEPTKRAGASEALTVTLPYSKEPFCVPDNLYIIGTMNTADRSLAQLDIALRRRFEFVEMMPDCGLLNTVEIEGIPVAHLLQAINERIEVLLDRDHTLGHSYFLPLAREGGNTFDNLARIFEKQIIPLLQEYFFEDWQRIQWVLNDHQKPEQYQFVSQGGATDLVSLFGNDVSSQITDRRWFIHRHAFTLKESYLYTIKKREMVVSPTAEPA